jgi:hypothetical protein
MKNEFLEEGTSVENCGEYFAAEYQLIPAF